MTLGFRVMSSRFKHSLDLLKLFVAVMRFYSHGVGFWLDMEYQI